uniref:Uncharacterized LOC100180649 n=1 Tax=Ciona intestinalis TaxID=7719 RepID=F6UA80_CIOIN|nr:uncharacterized protein LOC100180649 isoform X1 [Ciona intestinalis]|eukprot:XP_002121159.1 uncharacterized protein LOC100180649 isoform X1 [Ciona intestinalis]
MKVIMTGMSKTGTKTMCSALRILGYKVYDFEEQFWYLGPEFLKAVNEGCTTEEIREMLQDVDAVTDMPACILWEEILRAFPDAKLIHMERKSEDDWAKSWNKQIDAIRSNFTARCIVPLTPTGRYLRNYTNALGRAGFSLQTFYPWKQPSVNLPFCKLRYREHNSHVRLAAPKGQIIYFQHSDGWEPLCKFLGVPVPSVPYPHRNKGGEIIDEFVEESEMFKQIKKEITFLATIAFLLIGVGLYYFFR